MSFITLNSKNVTSTEGSYENHKPYNFTNTFRQGIEVLPKSSIAMTHAQIRFNNVELDWDTDAGQKGFRVLFGSREYQFDRYQYNNASPNNFNDDNAIAPLKTAMWFPLKESAGTLADVISDVVKSLNTISTPSLYNSFSYVINYTAGEITGYNINSLVNLMPVKSAYPDGSFLKDNIGNADFTYTALSASFEKTSGSSAKNNYAIGYTSTEGIYDTDGLLEVEVKMDPGGFATPTDVKPITPVIHTYLFGVTRWGGPNNVLWEGHKASTGELLRGWNGIPNNSNTYNPKMACDFAFMPVVDTISGTGEIYLNIVKYVSDELGSRMEIIATGKALDPLHCPALSFNILPTTAKVFPNPTVADHRLGLRMVFSGNKVTFFTITDATQSTVTQVAYTTPPAGLGVNVECFKMNDGYYPLQTKLMARYVGDGFDNIKANLVGTSELVREQTNYLAYEGKMMPNGFYNRSQQVFTNQEDDASIIAQTAAVPNSTIDRMTAAGLLTRNISFAVGINNEIRWWEQIYDKLDPTTANIQALLGLSNSVYISTPQTVSTQEGHNTEFLTTGSTSINQDGGYLIILGGIGRIGSNIGSLQSKDRVIACVPNLTPNQTANGGSIYTYVPPTPIYLKLNNVSSEYINNLTLKVTNAFGIEVSSIISSNFAFHLIGDTPISDYTTTKYSPKL